MGEPELSEDSEPMGHLDIDPLEFKRELSKICHLKGVLDWEKLVKAIFDWIAAAKPEERPERLTVVVQLIERLEDKQPDEIHRRLKAFVDALPVK